MKWPTLLLVSLALLFGSLKQSTAANILPGFDLLHTPEQPAFITGLGNVTEHGVPFGPGNTDTIIQPLTGLADGVSGPIQAQIVALAVAGTILDGQFAGLNFTVGLTRPQRWEP